MPRPKGRRCPKRHRTLWIITFGKAAGILWCYQCGAICDINEKVKGRFQWTYPTGIGGENPWRYVER